MNPDIPIIRPPRTRPPDPDPEPDPDPGMEELAEGLAEAVDGQIAAALDQEAQARLWLRAIVPLLNLRSHESDPSGRVQLAFDMMHIAACERVSRLMRADLAPDRG